MSGGTRVQTTQTEPWGPQKDYLEEGFEATKDMWRAGQLNPAYYGGQTVAGFTKAQQDAQANTLRYVADPQTEKFMEVAQAGLGDTLNYGAGAMQHGVTAGKTMDQTRYSTFLPFNQYQYKDLLAGKVDTDTGPFKDVADVYGRQAMGQLTGEVLPFPTCFHQDHQQHH